MKKLKLAWDWIVKSSADPKKTSLAVRAFFIGIVPTILFTSKVLHVDLNDQVLTDTINGVEQAVFAGLTFVSSIMFAAGLIRKLWTTATGQNEVVKAYAAK